MFLVAGAQASGAPSLCPAIGAGSGSRSGGRGCSRCVAPVPLLLPVWCTKQLWQPWQGGLASHGMLCCSCKATLNVCKALLRMTACPSELCRALTTLSCRTRTHRLPHDWCCCSCCTLRTPPLPSLSAPTLLPPKPPSRNAPAPSFPSSSPTPLTRGPHLCHPPLVPPCRCHPAAACAAARRRAVAAAQH